jgi:hypothetical protein
VLVDDVGDLHPGHVVVDYHDDTTRPPSGRSGTGRGLPDLVLLHKFCNEHLFPDCGVALRRAHLGWATEQFDLGTVDPGSGDSGSAALSHYDQLGLHGAPWRGFELYQRHWRVRKMRYACKACRYYAGWFQSEWS